MMNSIIIAFLIGQLCVVLFIALHDWIPLGRFSNLSGIRASDSRGRLFFVTLLSTLPFAIGLAGTAYYASSGFPIWLMWLLWISYGFGLYGMLKTWWIPYLVKGDPARTERYQARFAGTHAFLPIRNGIRPDTLHVCFHAVLVSTVILLGILTFSEHGVGMDHEMSKIDSMDAVAGSIAG